MAGKRKKPKLRIDGMYYTAKVYTPDGKRTSLSFGYVDDRPDSEVRAVFAKWVELYEQQPQKVLSFKSPYDAVRQVLNPKQEITVKEFLEKYVQWASGHLRPDRNGKENPDIRKIKRASRFLAPYDNWPVQDFGPDELRTVQKALLNYEYKAGSAKKKYTRRGINDTIKWIRYIWEWGLGRQIVSVEQVQSLKEVKGLRIGQSTAVENHKRSRVTEEEFRKVINATSKVIGDMLQLIWHTGMRPYEVCEMRPFDILTEDPDCWLYIPGRDKSPLGDHKTAYAGRVKVIPITLEAQNIFKARIKDFNSKDYIFSPIETVRELRENRTNNRKTPLKQGNRRGTNRKAKPAMKPGEKYDNNSFNHACKKACESAEVEVFVPYDLRRTAATRLRAALGKEAAQVLLGHTKMDTTDIYLLEEVQETIKVAKEFSSKK
jgi:integrase